MFETLGGIDELSAHLGMALEENSLGIDIIRERLLDIQSWLLDIGAVVAVQDDESVPAFEQPVPEILEQWIDAMDSQLPPLRNFILPVSTFSLFRSTVHGVTVMVVC